MSGRHSPSVATRALRSPAVWLMLALVGLALAAPLIAPHGPVEIVATGADRPPSLAHPFGTDANGMDVFSRVLHAARIDLLLPVLAALVSTGVGTLTGLFSGYIGGFVDAATQRAMEVLQAFPVVMLAMAILVALEPTMTNIVLVIALINIPPYYRTVRAIVRPMRQAAFIDAARCLGQGPVAIVLRHLLPNVWLAVLSQFTVNFAVAIQALAGLSFLGLGVAFPQPEWGLMCEQGADGMIRGVWWPSLFPGGAILLTVLALNRLARWIETMAKLK
ncbi:MAG: ABC transporter permease [Sphingobium sp.]